MADLLTVYDDDEANTFIDCTICDKRMRGETQYKIHVTTLQHLKKEEALVAQGEIPRPPPLPQWTDIRDYLEYLNLDEPIIGLSSLIQVPDFVSEDGKTVLKYKCRLCAVEMDLFSMVAHVVGRKHRQKYLELKRPDLVTWQDNAQKQPGLVAKAKAAVVEKQEGWGKPELLKRPQNNFRNVYQAGSDSWPDVHEKLYLGQEIHRQSSLVEDIDRQPHRDENRFGRLSYPREQYGQYDRPNPNDTVCHQSYSEESRHQRPYQEPNIQGFLRERAEREVPARPYVDPSNVRRPHFQEGYEETTLGRRQYSTRGEKRNRFNDKDFRIHNAAQHSGNSEYQEEQTEGRMYLSYGERGSGVDAVSMHGRSFPDMDRRGEVREFEERTHIYAQRLDPRGFPRAYHEEPVPAKKKRKSRFSDATAEEIALAQRRHSDEFSHKAGQRPQNQPRRALIQEKHQLFSNPAMDSGSTSHFNPGPENVLDVLNDIEIDNMEDAKYLKEKLCTVLKEFQVNKSLRAEEHALQPNSDHRGGRQMDHHRDAYADNLRDDPVDHGRYLENKGFQEVRQYQDRSRNFQDSRQYQEVRQHKDDPRGPRETRHYEDDSGDYREPRRFNSSSREFPSEETRQYVEDSRGFQKTRFQENTIGFPERGCFDNDLREKAGHFEDYSRAPQDGRNNAEGLRGTQEPKYSDFRGFGNVDSERNWNHQKRHSLDRFGGPADKRDFQENFDNPPIHYQPPPHKDSGMYAGRGQQRSHQVHVQHVHHSGEELYDPFHPSPSPPPQAPTSTSLNKIASTLLELVARR